VGKTFTCILHVPNHVSPVQTFYTRADSAEEAASKARLWFLDGEVDWTEGDVDVSLVFEGRIQPLHFDADASDALFAAAYTPPSDESAVNAQRRENIMRREVNPESVCPNCGHAMSRHDPEDGCCDAHRPDGEFGVCPCGRDPSVAPARRQQPAPGRTGGAT
jgi:hypothetical protein